MSIMKHNMLIYVKPAPFTSFSTVLNVPCLGNLVKSWVWHGIVIKVHEWQRNIFKSPRPQDYGFGHKLYSMNV